jgi:hypothetical protein
VCRGLALGAIVLFSQDSVPKAAQRSEQQGTNVTHVHVHGVPEGIARFIRKKQIQSWALAGRCVRGAIKRFGGKHDTFASTVHTTSVSIKSQPRRPGNTTSTLITRIRQGSFCKQPRCCGRQHRYPPFLNSNVYYILLAKFIPLMY